MRLGKVVSCKAELYEPSSRVGTRRKCRDISAPVVNLIRQLCWQPNFEADRFALFHA
jgi:hypothetical protein